MEFVPEHFANYITRELNGRRAEVLEVGGGAVARMPLPDAHLTVLDSSPDALRRNGAARDVLIGDAEDYDYGERRFDLAVFWNVLEHVRRPEAAVERASRSLKPDGMIVVRGPELYSLKAVVTRYTPHWIHVLYYRRVLGIRDAGKDGRPPCRVEHQGDADRQALTSSLRRMGFRIAYELRYVGDQVTELKRFSRLAYLVYAAASAVARLLTRSRYGTAETEFILVARRPSPA